MKLYKIFEWVHMIPKYGRVLVTHPISTDQSEWAYSLCNVYGIYNSK